jgi:hypothetical protein
MTVVGFLDCGPARDRHRRAVMTDGCDAFVDEIVGAINATDGIVDLLGPIEGEDDVVEERSDLFCSFVQEKAGGQEGEVNLLFEKKIAESSEIVVQERFTARENDLANAKISQRCTVTFQILRLNLIVGLALPDVAHDATAVAAAVGIQDENRQRREARWRR